jgi:hypothetical protein
LAVSGFSLAPGVGAAGVGGAACGGGATCVERALDVGLDYPTARPRPAQAGEVQPAIPRDAPGDGGRLGAAVTANAGWGRW